MNKLGNFLIKIFNDESRPFRFCLFVKIFNNFKQITLPVFINNLVSIDIYQIIDENWKNYLFKILEDFHKQTKSKRAAFIIENFDQEISKFVHVVPNEVIDKLNFPVKEIYKIA